MVTVVLEARIQSGPGTGYCRRNVQRSSILPKVLFLKKEYQLPEAWNQEGVISVEALKTDSQYPVILSW